MLINSFRGTTRLSLPLRSANHNSVNNDAVNWNNGRGKLMLTSYQKWMNYLPKSFSYLNTKNWFVVMSEDSTSYRTIIAYHKAPAGNTRPLIVKIKSYRCLSNEARTVGQSTDCKTLPVFLNRFVFWPLISHSQSKILLCAELCRITIPMS